MIRENYKRGLEKIVFEINRRKDSEQINDVGSSLVNRKELRKKKGKPRLRSLRYKN